MVTNRGEYGHQRKVADTRAPMDRKRRLTLELEADE